MKRGHRSAHRLIWLVLAPILAATIWLAVTQRPAEPINDTLPDLLVQQELEN